MKTEQEIQQLADDAMGMSTSSFSGMSYEEGIQAACEWILEIQKDHPLEGDND